MLLRQLVGKHNQVWGPGVYSLGALRELRKLHWQVLSIWPRSLSVLQDLAAPCVNRSRGCSMCGTTTQRILQGAFGKVQAACVTHVRLEGLSDRPESFGLAGWLE